MKVAVLGLGAMGAPIARRLEGFELAVYNRTPGRAAGLRARVAASPADAAAGADVVVSTLADGAAVAAVLLDEDGALAGDPPPRVVVEMRLDRALMLDVVNGSFVGSAFTRYKTTSLVADDYRATFAANLMRKDLALALDNGVPLPVTATVQTLLDGCVEAGSGELDFSVLVPEFQRRVQLT